MLVFVHVFVFVSVSYLLKLLQDPPPARVNTSQISQVQLTQPPRPVSHILPSETTLFTLRHRREEVITSSSSSGLYLYDGLILGILVYWVSVYWVLVTDVPGHNIAAVPHHPTTEQLKEGRGKGKVDQPSVLQSLGQENPKHPEQLGHFLTEGGVLGKWGGEKTPRSHHIVAWSEWEILVGEILGGHKEESYE